MADLNFIHWLVIGSGLLVLELVTSTTYVIWIAISAYLTSLVAWIFPGIHWEFQGLVFSVFSILSMYIWWLISKRSAYSKDSNLLNQRTQRYIGKTAILLEATSNSASKIKLDDSIWKVTCVQKLEAGQVVKVIDVQGMTFKVIAVDDTE